MPFLANNKSVSRAALMSEMPSPQYTRIGRSSGGSAAYGFIVRLLSCPYSVVSVNPLGNTRVVVKHDLPGPVGVDFHVIRYHGDCVCLWTDKLCEKRTDDRFHSRRQDDHGDIILQRPMVKFCESGVKPDIYPQSVGT